MKLNELGMKQIEKLAGIDSTRVTMKITKKDGTELFRDLGPNASLLSGVQDYVKNMWNIQSTDLVEIQTLDSQFTGLPTPNYLKDKRQVFGFGLGIDGAYGNSVNVVKRHDLGYEKEKLIAFQTVTAGVDDLEANSKKYALRVEDGGDVLWYIKRFVPEYIVVSARSKTKVPNLPNINYRSSEDVRVWCRINIKMNTEECIRWFGKKYGTSDNAYFNSIILFAGRPCTVEVNGKSINTFRDIIATNKINFKNENLNNKEIEFTYDIYFV